MLKNGMKVKFLESVGGLQFSVGCGDEYGHGPGVIEVTEKNAEFCEGEIRCGHAVLVEVPKKEGPNAPIDVLPVLATQSPVVGDDTPAKRKPGRRSIQQ